MKILEKQFTSCGFEFKQVHREGEFAVYKKWKPEYRSPIFEAIEIKSHNGYTIAGNYCAPSEMYPSNEQWGVLGFTCTDLKQAYARIDKMKIEKEKSAALVTPGVKRGRGRPKGRGLLP